jgi:hypothetical protein
VFIYLLMIGGLNFMVHVINEGTDTTSDLMVLKMTDKY